MNIDPDGTLPAERTALAWGRTFLGLAGVFGLAAADAVYAGRVIIATLCGALAIVAIALSWSVAQRRAETITTAEHRLDSPSATLRLAVMVVGLSIVVLALILL